MAIQNGYCFCANEWFLDVSIRNELPLLLMISSLCAKQGYSNASNDYFATNLGLTTETTSRKLNKLQAKGYITITYQKRGAEVINREIRLTKLASDCSTTSTVDCSECQPTIDQNVKENITDKEIINNNPDGLFTRASRAVKKNPYGEFGKVMLTNEEYERALEKYDGDCDKLEFAINILDTYLAQDKKRERKYTSHYAVLTPKSSWVRQRVDEGYVPCRPKTYEEMLADAKAKGLL